MLEEIKKQFHQFLIDLGYQNFDYGNYQEEFPRIMIRTNDYQCVFSFDVRYSMVSLKVDIFSTYNGEKEIIEISENINNNLPKFRKRNPNITSLAQTGMVIIGDNETGPVRKHGILTYKFILTTEEAQNDSTGD